eukprot:scpid95265/ scgid9909/ 
MASLDDSCNTAEASCTGQNSARLGDSTEPGRVSHAARSGDERNIPEAVQRLRDSLIEQFIRATVDLDEGMVDECVAEPSVSDVHVQLIILSRPDLRQEFENTGFDSSCDMWRVEHVFTKAAGSLEHIQLESLFDMSGQQEIQLSIAGRTYRILVVASAGCGKTFVFTKVAPLKWARKELWTEFDLLVTRKLRSKEVREATSVCSLLGIGECEMFDSDECKSIVNFVRRQASRVCLVLDGLDEIQLSECSEFVRNVINGKCLPGLRLVVTSRPCVQVLRVCGRKQFDKRVELVGFRQQDVETYIRKVLRSPEEASALVTAVRDDQGLASM